MKQNLTEHQKRALYPTLIKESSREASDLKGSKEKLRIKRGVQKIIEARSLYAQLNYLELDHESK